MAKFEFIEVLLMTYVVLSLDPQPQNIMKGILKFKSSMRLLLLVKHGCIVMCHAFHYRVFQPSSQNQATFKHKLVANKKTQILLYSNTLDQKQFQD